MATSLTDRAATELLVYIERNGLTAGDRLPPEHRLAPQLAVSRTILREAVAGLRAQGKLTSRRGSGVYVAVPGASLRVASEDIGKVSDVLDLLELRAAVEVEAAGLAARRRSQADIDAMSSALARLDAAEGIVSAVHDFEFHHAIAAATQNERFAAFLDQFKYGLIPRGRLREAGTETERRAYVARLQNEHRLIAGAIEAKDALLARDAMRQHLIGSIERYSAAAQRKEGKT
jgi:GntR family transcriptional repressor for pyruvate dehydrogenase complex